jgi:hypothetical protein
VTAPFPGPASETASEEPIRSRRAPAEGRSPKALRAIKVKLIDGIDMQCPLHLWNIRLREEKPLGKKGRTTSIGGRGVAAPL